ncbi:hypothetical protein DPEC_G00225350 [Dallia pectoralis]|uniref:Uncharacterized protein n=1 Tax=Dallia pectoralis TaxID=75939 RepID=A0ACC2G0D3_DALPE|nr:hypothetical protein DPEC_G00225350 [Dallia pectoralis]
MYPAGGDCGRSIFTPNRRRLLDCDAQGSWGTSLQLQTSAWTVGRRPCSVVCLGWKPHCIATASQNQHFLLTSWVAQRYLWQPLTVLNDAEKLALLIAPLSIVGLFGVALFKAVVHLGNEEEEERKTLVVHRTLPHQPAH